MIRKILFFIFLGLLVGNVDAVRRKHKAPKHLSSKASSSQKKGKPAASKSSPSLELDQQDNPNEGESRANNSSQQTIKDISSQLKVTLTLVNQLGSIDLSADGSDEKILQLVAELRWIHFTVLALPINYMNGLNGTQSLAKLHQEYNSGLLCMQKIYQKIHALNDKRYANLIEGYMLEVSPLLGFFTTGNPDSDNTLFKTHFLDLRTYIQSGEIINALKMIDEFLLTGKNYERAIPLPLEEYLDFFSKKTECKKRQQGDLFFYFNTDVDEDLKGQILSWLSTHGKAANETGYRLREAYEAFISYDLFCSTVKIFKDKAIDIQSDKSALRDNPKLAAECFLSSSVLNGALAEDKQSNKEKLISTLFKVFLKQLCSAHPEEDEVGSSSGEQESSSSSSEETRDEDSSEGSQTDASTVLQSAYPLSVATTSEPDPATQALPLDAFSSEKPLRHASRQDMDRTCKRLMWVHATSSDRASMEEDDQSQALEASLREILEMVQTLYPDQLIRKQSDESAPFSTYGDLYIPSQVEPMVCISVMIFANRSEASTWEAALDKRHHPNALQITHLISCLEEAGITLTEIQKRIKAHQQPQALTQPGL